MPNLKLAIDNENEGWDEVASVEDVGVQQTIGLEVEGTNNHVTNGVVSHNTQITAVALPLFLLGNDPTLRIKLVCLSDDAAKERLSAIKAYIETDEDFKTLFPGIIPGNKEEWSKHKLFVERKTIAKDASVDAKGIMSSAIGGRADILLVDDIFDQRTAVSQPSTREQHLATYAQVWLSRVEPNVEGNENKRQVIAICTRWHEDDLLGFVTSDPIMLNQYGVLIQKVADDFSGLDCDVIIPDQHVEEYKEYFGHELKEILI